MWHQIDHYSNSPHETWAATCGVGCLIMVKCPSDGAHNTVALTYVPGVRIVVEKGKGVDPVDTYSLEQLPGFGQVESLDKIPDDEK